MFQIIMLSASANKLSRLKEQAEEYAALIMEELDPEGLGYIEVSFWLPIRPSLSLWFLFNFLAVKTAILLLQKSTAPFIFLPE